MRLLCSLKVLHALHGVAFEAKGVKIAAVHTCSHFFAERSRSLFKRVLIPTLVLSAFAANSLLCRLALRDAQIDAATFTAVRLLSGALALQLMLRLRSPFAHTAGSWRSAAALTSYAAAFSLAYVHLTAATGALILFGAIQLTMLGVGFFRGERLSLLQGAGFVLACAGLLVLLLPGVSAPPQSSALLMLSAGVGSGIYSLRGRGQADALAVSAGNFLRTIPLALVFSALSTAPFFTPRGLGLAFVSGAVTTGAAYALWYSVVKQLNVTSAAAVQLCVPVLAGLGGVAFLSESWTSRLSIAMPLVLGGVALVLTRRRA
jgi:drug/metabolite transporter (DMT)-like permease